MFYDIERDIYITNAELEKEFHELRRNGETDAETFSQYVNNCLTIHNGTLEKVWCKE